MSLVKQKNERCRCFYVAAECANPAIISLLFYTYDEIFCGLDIARETFKITVYWFPNKPRIMFFRSSRPNIIQCRPHIVQYHERICIV